MVLLAAVRRKIVEVCFLSSNLKYGTRPGERLLSQPFMPHIYNFFASIL